MKAARLTAGLLGIALSLLPQILGDGISKGVRFFSPDREYSVSLIEKDGELHYEIEKADGGVVDDSIVMPTVLLYLHWGANSRSIVTIEHIANGSVGRLLFFKSGRWNDVEISPPREKEWREFAVTDLNIKSEIAHYRFAVRDKADNGMATSYKLCDLIVNLQTGTIGNLKWTATSEAKLASEFARKPTYVPPMEER
jgi:hypothetical protein